MLVIQSKETGYNTKISEIEKKPFDYDHDTYITTSEFNKLTAENVAARLAQANLASENDVANFVKRQILMIINKKILLKIQMN